MLPATARLSRAQCSLLLSDSATKVAFNRLGTLKYNKNTEIKGLNAAAYGFSVITGSKQEKRAVARNTLRRRLYALFSRHSAVFGPAPLSGMLYVSKHAYAMPFEELSSELHALLAKTQKNS